MLKALSCVVISVCLIAAACTKKVTDNGIPAPLQKIIQADTNCTCHPSINEYLWKNGIVYVLGIFGDDAMFCDGIPQFFDGDGNHISLPSGYTIDKFYKNSRFVKTVWRCEP